MSRGLSLSLWVWLCILLHATLVLAHVVLLALRSSGTTHTVVVSLARANELSSYISLASQLIIIPYTAALLLITQTLAVRDLLARRHTLTAAYDVWSAWSGFGAACISLYRQTTVPASVLGVFRVAIYLGCLAVLHITTPSLFSMQTFVRGAAMVVPTTVGMPTIHDASLTPTSADTNATLNPWSTADEMLSSIVLLGYNTTVGLRNSTVFDIASPNTGVGNIEVGMQTANVSCGYVPGVSVASAGIPDYQINAVYDGYNFSWTANMYYAGGVMLAFTRYDASPNTSILLGRNAFIITPLNLTDDGGNTGPTQLNGIADMSLNLLGCTLSWEKQRGLVDQQTRLLQELPTSPVQSRVWTAWTPQIQEGGLTAGGGYLNVDNQVDSWADMLDGAPFASDGSNDSLLTTDRFVSSTLGDVSGPTTSLARFERALGDMTAAAYWSVGHIVDSATQGTFISVNSSTSLVDETMSRLNIDITQLVVGLCASVVLLMLATELALRSRKVSVDPNVQYLGVLQLLWLMVHDPSLPNRIATVAEPTTSQLRQAGMVGLDATAVLLSERHGAAAYNPAELTPTLSTSKGIGDGLYKEDSN